MRAEVRPATPEDVAPIAAAMRAADREEVRASHDHTAEQALAASLAASTAAWTGVIDGEPVCMFGVGPVSILGGTGAPWMLGTARLEQYPRTFLRRCRPCVAAMRAVYPMLANYVDDRNEVSKRWLAWLGFTFDDNPIVARSGVAFRKFSMGVIDV